MSNKGKVFSDADLPRQTQQRIKNKQLHPGEREQLTAWLTDQTERNKIVAWDGDTGLIAEELTERAMREHAKTDAGAIDPAVLSLLRSLSALEPQQRRNVLDAFDEDAALRIPFGKKAPKKK